MNTDAPVLQRYTPLACWVVVLLTALFIGLKIVGYGYLAPGDARRHVAKPFAHKPYSQIIIMRPEYVVDHDPGWEWLLGVLQRTLGWSEDGLMSFSIVSLVLLIFCLPTLWLRRPEAWLAAILVQMIAIPELMIRWVQARPYLVTEAVLMAILLGWRNPEPKRPSWPKLIWTSVGIALAVWMHGIWYFWVDPLAAFFLTQRWREFLWLAACWLSGTIVAGCLTGNPVSFLYEAVFQAHLIYSEHLPGWMLVGELQPSQGEFATLVLLALVWLWTKSRNEARPSLFVQPVFWVIALNWLAGFTADRFWADWGMPAALVWMATQFDDGWPGLSGDNPLKRLMVCGLIAVPLFLNATNDLGQRYTFSSQEYFLRANDESLRGWTPEKAGIFYADSMRFFYNTFFANPTADWRYIEGFEPALMLAEDWKVYFEIQRSHRAPESYEPWIKRMRAEDRLAIDSPYQPNIPALEWKSAGNLWIGRLPRK